MTYFWRHEALYDVMTSFWRQDELFGVVTCFLCHDVFVTSGGSSGERFASHGDIFDCRGSSIL